MILQAFIDDSWDAGGVFVLGGYIASAEAWARFSKEWEALLPYATLNKHGRYAFKMAQMAMNAERMARVQAFYRVIEKHVLGYVSSKIDISELKGIPSRIIVPGTEIDWGNFINPYFVAFRCLMDMFHNNRAMMAEAIPPNEKVDFYFDEQTEKKAIREMWDNYIKQRRDEVRELYGNEPRFENDEDFLPLQAADFWAWWVRKWYADGTPEKIDKGGDFGLFKGTPKKLLRITIETNQDALVPTMARILRAEMGPGKPIFDVKFSPPKIL